MKDMITFENAVIFDLGTPTRACRVLSCLGTEMGRFVELVEPGAHTNWAFQTPDLNGEYTRTAQASFPMLEEGQAYLLQQSRALQVQILTHFKSPESNWGVGDPVWVLLDNAAFEAVIPHLNKKAARVVFAPDGGETVVSLKDLFHKPDTMATQEARRNFRIAPRWAVLDKDL
jgi:hypothetical protein